MALRSVAGAGASPVPLMRNKATAAGNRHQSDCGHESRQYACDRGKAALWSQYSTLAFFVPGVLVGGWVSTPFWDRTH
jgi:hypothetical protein